MMPTRLSAPGRTDRSPVLTVQPRPNNSDCSRSAVVRREMASAAVRHPGADVELLLQELSRHAEDAKDPIIPQLLWVALEPQLAADPVRHLAWLRAIAPNNPLVTDTLLPRAMR